MSQPLSSGDIESWRSSSGFARGQPPARLRGEEGLDVGRQITGMRCTAVGPDDQWDAALYHRSLSLVEVTRSLAAPTVLMPDADADRDGILVWVTADWPDGPDRLTVVTTSGPHRFVTDCVTDAVILRIPAESFGVGRGVIASLSGAALARSHLATAAVCAVRGFAASVLGTDVDSFSTLAAESAMIDLLVVTVAEANARRTESSSNTEYVRRRTAELIELHHRDPEFSPTTLAERMHLSRRQFYRHFEACDHSVAEMIADRRLRAARGLLVSNPSASVAWVARASGFGSVGPFRLRFRREFGVGPTEFRDQMAENNDGVYAG